MQTFDRGEEVVLVLVAEPEVPVPAELDPATLEYATSRGVVRLVGEAHFEDESVIRFRADRDPEVIQRRAFVRVHTPQEVALETLSSGGSTQVYTIDLSGGGMLLSGGRPLERDDTVSFEIRLHDQDPIRGVARVVRVQADGQRAMEFAEIEEADRQRLIRFVFAQLRTSRAKTRGDHV